MLSIENGQVLTLDVWDTLLRRKCHPDEIKLIVLKEFFLEKFHLLKDEYKSLNSLFSLRKNIEIIIGDEKQKNGYDDEYEILDVWRKIIIKAVNFDYSLKDLEDEVRRFTEKEIKVEINMSYPDNKINKLIIDKGHGSDIYLLSDFYIDSSNLLKIVESSHPNMKIKGVISSCSVGLNKRSGRLFEYFQSIFGTKYKKHIHVGDNMHSDYSMPKKLGIDSFLYINKSEEENRIVMNKAFESRLKNDFHPYWKEMLEETYRLKKKFPLTSDSKIKNLGVDFSPLFVFYVIYAIQEAKKLNLNKIYYFTREGEFLKLIHEAILKVCDEKENIPKPVLLEVSRLSTFSPSVDKISLKELNRVWTMYPNQTIRAFLCTLGLNPSDFSEYVSRHELDFDNKIDQPWKNEKFLKLINDPDFYNLANNKISEFRKRIINYLDSVGINKETKKVYVVDIGWRGTIQDNLSYIKPDIEWHGLYLALFKFLNVQPKNCFKNAFLFNDNLGTNFENSLSPQSPLEMLFNSPYGSVIGYSENDPVSAIRKVDLEENISYKAFTNYFQDGVLSAAGVLWNYLEQRALLAEDFSNEAFRLAKSLIANPPAEMAKAYFSLSHNETFGNNIFVKNNSKIPLSIVGNVLRPKNMVAELRTLALKSGWPSGFLAANNITFLKNFNSNILRPLRLRVKELSFNTLNGVDNEKIIKKNDNDDLIRKISNANYENELSFNEFKKKNRIVDEANFVINWLVPDFGYGSGGHVTILRLVNNFKSLGIKNRIYISGKSSHSSSEALFNFVNDKIMSVEGVEFYVNDENYKDADISICTFWKTAYDLLGVDNVKFKSYLIQDFEPYFYPVGSNWILAEDTYKFGYYGICASKWLKNKSDNYGMNSCYFNLGYDPNVYYIDEMVERDSDRVLVYMRPSTERRGTEILIATLNILKKIRPNTRIAIFGTSDLNSDAIEFKAEILGLINEEQLRKQHSMSSITLLTSLTNYSLIPIEAMACGSVVVDVDVESMRETFGNTSPVQLIYPRPQKIAEHIAKLLDDNESIREISKNGVEYAKKYTWDNAFCAVENGVFSNYFSDEEKICDGLYRGINGSKIFYVKNNMKFLVKSLEDFDKFGFKFSDVKEIPVKYLLQLNNGGLFNGLF